MDKREESAIRRAERLSLRSPESLTPGIGHAESSSTQGAAGGFRVLLVEDSLLDAELLLRAIRDSGLSVTWERVATRADFLAGLAKRPDIILADYDLPHFSGKEALELIRGRTPDIPVIIVSGSISDSEASELLTLGANDFLLKDRLGRIKSAIQGALKLKHTREAQRRAQDQLLRLAAIVESSQDAIVSRALDGVIFTWNPAAERLFGWSAAEAIGQDISIIIPPDHRGEIATNQEQLKEGLPMPPFDTIRVSKSGRRINVAVTQSPIRNEAGQTIGLSSMFHDITERVVSDRRRAMEHAVTKALSEAQALQEAMPLLIQTICETLDWAYGAHWAWNETEQRLCRAAFWSDFEPEFAPADAHYWLKLGDGGSGGLLRRAWLEGDFTWRADLLQDGSFRRAPSCEKFGLRSAYCFPVLAGAEVIGAMEFFGRDVRAPDEMLLSITESIGRQIGQFIQRKQAEEGMKRLNRVYATLSAINTLIVRVRDRERLLHEACRIAAEHGGFGIAMVARFDPTTLQVEPTAWAGVDAEVAAEMNFTADPAAPLGQGTIGRAARERKPVLCNDMRAEPNVGRKWEEALKRGYQSVISLPLMQEDALSGVFTLMSKEKGFFNNAEVKLLTELAADISFALDHIAKIDKVNFLAYYDPLTGAANRTLLEDRLAHEIAYARRYSRRLAVAVVNLDHFKLVINSLGHAAGDQLLKNCLKRIRSCVRESDTIARFGGDEFVLVLPDQTDAQTTRRVTDGLSSEPHVVQTLQRVLRSISEPMMVRSGEINVTCSIGVSLFSQDGEDAETLLRNATTALSRAKQRGGNSYQFYTAELNARVAERLALHSALRHALERDEFALHYQPKICLKTGRITGSEALLRWNKPGAGLVSPAEFVPVLEETGLIVDAGRWVMQKAASTYRKWQTSDPNPPRIAVNVSQLQLAQEDFATAVESLLHSREDHPGVDFEITESLIMEDIHANGAKLRAIREMGVSIAIDDFGTGHSSLSYLARLPVDTVKVDRTFIAGIQDSPECVAIVTAIISLAHSLGLTVVAEGVETEEQVKLLRLLKCDEMQGYVISPPLPAEQFERWWKNYARGEFDKAQATSPASNISRTAI